MYKNKLDLGIEGIYQKREQVEINESIIGNNISTAPSKNNNFSFKSAFSTLSLRRKKSKEIKDPNISKDAEEHIYDVIDDSKMKHDVIKERPRLLTPAEEISNTIALHPDLKNILNEIYYHEVYYVIKQASHSFDSFEANSASLLKISILVTLKNIASLKTFGENEDLLNLSLDSALRFSKDKLWHEFIKTNNEKNEQESDDENYETIEGDYETIGGDNEAMNNQIKKDEEKEPDYMNVKESNYMDMNKGKPSFFSANATVEKENKEAPQEKQEKSQTVPSTCLN